MNFLFWHTSEYLMNMHCTALCCSVLCFFLFAVSRNVTTHCSSRLGGIYKNIAMLGDKCGEQVTRNCVLVHLVIWKNVCVCFSRSPSLSRSLWCVCVCVCANLCEQSFLNHLPFLLLIREEICEVRFQIIIQAPHGTSIIFSCIRENYADDG